MLQSSVNLPSCGAFYTANRGKAISQGFDFQVAAIVVEGLKASATLGYTDAYSRDIGALWESARSYFRVDYRWIDATPRGNPALANYDPSTGGPIGSAPNQAYEQLNLRLGVLHGGLDISAFVDNVTNSQPILGLTHASVADTLYSATALRPRTFGVTGLFRF